MDEPEDPHPDTLCARPPEPTRSATTPLAPALHLSTVFKVDDLDQIDGLYGKTVSGFIYARDGHPNSSQLAAKLAKLEGAEAGLVCSSGMGAESAAILSLVGAGDQVALSEGLYGRTGSLVANELGRFGVTHSYFDATRPETLRDALTATTRIAFVETISNPLTRLADLPALAEVCRASGVRLLVDHTYAPLLCRPLELGADLVIHSLTKFIAGHSDVTLGFLAGPAALVDRASALASTFGLSGNPFDCWLALRGLSTLAVRIDRASANALDLARRLEAHPKVGKVHYPGLPSHPDHARAARFLKGGFGPMMAIELAGRPEVDAFIRTLKHIPYAPSFGDVSTTLSHPTTTSHRFQSPSQWAGQGITPGLVRLSIGIEDVDDLWNDLRGALDRL